MSIASGIEEIIDGHAHPCLRKSPISLSDLAFSFCESNDPRLLQHVPHTVTMQAAVPYLAKRLGVNATSDDLIRFRNDHGLREYARRLLGPDKIRCILLDTGYPSEGLSIAESEETLGVPCREIMRIETVAESLLPGSSTVEDLLSGLEESLRRVDSQRVVAFKTIASYRCGLNLKIPSEGELASAFSRERRIFERTGSARLTERPLISAIVDTALRAARDLSLPVQVHTGFGDRQLDLRDSDPLLLRPLLQNGEFTDVPIVLLHASYPFVRSAGILAGLYPNVYVDLSLALPLTGHGGHQIVLELLEQSPVTKVLFGSDASVGPELLAWGAHVGRKVVGTALQRLVTDNWLTMDAAIGAGRRIFAENARSLYRLPGV